MQLIDRLKILHTLGYIHLDLKPENITIKTDDFTHPESSIVCLIDFGISKSYLTENGSHIEFETNVAFNGNLLFASPNALRQFCNFFLTF